jgi:hypothetical protein
MVQRNSCVNERQQQAAGHSDRGWQMLQETALLPCPNGREGNCPPQKVFRAADDQGAATGIAYNCLHKQPRRQLHVVDSGSDEIFCSSIDNEGCRYRGISLWICLMRTANHRLPLSGANWTPAESRPDPKGASRHGVPGGPAYVTTKLAFVPCDHRPPLVCIHRCSLPFFVAW